MEKAFETAAICGLFCESCRYYIATQENKGLPELAQKAGQPAEEMRCNGCRSDTVTYYCRTCDMKLCALEKGISFCSECGEYPCGILREFQAERPHRIELYESLDYVKEKGFPAWREKMIKNYSCEKCGNINSIYDFACRKCGNDPSNPYVGRNREEIQAYMNKQK